jgi:hypothetical protein
MKHVRIALAAVFLFSAAALPIAAADMDLVVMVDTSTSMFPYFDELMNYLIQDLLTAKLHTGDTFHLLSFSSTPEEEISLGMGSDDAARKAFGRLLLLQPLGRYTDLIAALTYLNRYAHGLPETNPKTILILTDGVHDPPPGSPNRGTPEEIRAKIEEVAESLRKAGWTMHLVKVPPKPVEGEEGLTSYLNDIARVLDVPIVPYQSEDRTHVTGEIMGFPTLEFPPALGKVGSRFRAPFQVRNFKGEPVIVKLSHVLSEGVELLEKPVTVTVPPRGSSRLDVPLALPSSLAAGDYKKLVTLSFEDDIRISPTEGILEFTYTGAGGFSLPGVDPAILLYVAAAAAAIVLLILLVLFLRKRLQELPSGARPQETSRTPAAREERNKIPVAPETAGTHHHHGRRTLIPLMQAGEAPGAGLDAAPGSPVKPTIESLKRSLPRSEPDASGLPRMLEMRVSEQNSHIGFRNIHRIPEGGSRGVGGGFSAYLIFIVPFPRKIAEIRNEGGRYTFIPLRPEFFPALTGHLSDCIGVDIPMVTPKGMGFTIRFRQWISPLEEINALLRLSRS